MTEAWNESHISKLGSLKVAGQVRLLPAALIIVKSVVLLQQFNGMYKFENVP